MSLRELRGVSVIGSYGGADFGFVAALIPPG